MPIDPPETRVAVVESRLDNHEKVCGDRYAEITANFKDVGSKLDRIMWAVLGGLFVVLAYVVVNGRPWEKVGG